MMVKIANPSLVQPDGLHAVTGFALYEPSASGCGITSIGWSTSWLLLHFFPLPEKGID
jgi:hypothetical protein